MITLPTNFVDNLISTMGTTISDVLPLALFVGGIILACYILSNVFWSWVDRGNGINRDK
jgi:hypothetical protein